MQELFQRFQSLHQEYASFKEQCEGKVTTWRWTEQPRHDPRPFWYERNRRKRGNFLKSPPIRSNGFHEYGYDSTGNLLVERNHVSSEPDRIWFYESFHIRNQNTVEIAHFNYHSDKEPISLSRSYYQGNQIILWERCAKHGNMREKYYWEKDRVVSIDIEYSRIRENKFVTPTPWQKVDISYTHYGSLEKIVVHWLNHPEQPKELIDIAYHRLEESQNLRSLLNVAKEKIYASIVETITKLDLAEDVYCIAITWSPGQYQSLPPHLGIGFSRDRENWIAEHGKEEAKWYMWNPAEFSFQIIDQTVFHGDELIQICELLNQECGRHSKWHQASKMLSEVAKMLVETNWEGKMKTSPDFIAYATDYELSDFQKYLKYSVTKEKFSYLKKEGLLV